MRRICAAMFGMAMMMSAHAGSVTPDEVLVQIRQKGVEPIKEAYFSCWDATKSEGYELVKTGSDGWLRIAAILAKASEGCYSIRLHSAIALASIKNPEGVLRLVDSDRSLAAEDICMPFMTDEFQPSRIRKQLSILNSLERAMKNVTSPDVQKQKKKCLAIINAAQEDSRAQLNRVTDKIDQAG